jgi:hypothetical protein
MDVRGDAVQGVNVSDDREIQHHISELIEEEHGLRTAVGSGSTPAAAEHDRLAKIEVELDRCWDLLRQRQARREFGSDPEAAHLRSVDVVEGYLD